MLELTEIQEMVKEVVDTYLHNNSKARASKDPKSYRLTYWDEVYMADEQRVHALGEVPVELFERKVPNETPEQRAYRKLSFEATTMPIWNKAVQSVQGRVWNDMNYAIKFPDAEQAEYFTVAYPKHKKLSKWFRNVRLPIKLYDANALMVVMPKELPTRINEDGERVVDDAEEVSPECIIYTSEKVLHNDSRHVLLITDEKTVVRHGNTTTKDGLVFLIIDDTYIWKAEQVGKKSDYEFDVFVYYEHGLGEVPAQPLGGVPKEQEGHLYFSSYFHPAVGDLNTALFDESTLSIAKVANVYPERWEVVEECAECDGRGKVFDDDAQRLVTCEHCEGRGTPVRNHTLNAISVKLPDRFDDRPTPPTPPAGYLNKDNDSPKFLRDEIIRKKEDAFAHINIDVSNKPYGMTATERKIDREELFSFLLSISEEEFEAYKWAFDMIGRMRWAERFEDNILVSPPQDFTIRDHAELTDEMKQAREAGLPQIAYRKLLEEYQTTRFTSDAEMRIMTDIVYEADRLMGVTTQEALLQLGQRVTTTVDVVIHTSIHTFIDQLMQEQEDWLTKDRATQLEEIRAKAQAVVDALPSLNANILEEL